MKKCLLLIFFLILFCAGLHAQLGFTTAPTHGLASEWQVLTENYITHRHADFLKNGITAVLDYTFNLKAPQWQIRPSLHATQTQFDYLEHEFRVYAVGIQSNFNFIPFRDAQQEGMGKATCYIQFSPGIDYVRMGYFQLNPEGGGQGLVEVLADKTIAVNGGINLLIDLPLTELLTISPVLGIRYYPDLKWKGFLKPFLKTTFPTNTTA